MPGLLGGMPGVPREGLDLMLIDTRARTIAQPQPAWRRYGWIMPAAVRWLAVIVILLATILLATACGTLIWAAADALGYPLPEPGRIVSFVGHMA